MPRIKLLVGAIAVCGLVVGGFTLVGAGADSTEEKLENARKDNREFSLSMYSSERRSVAEKWDTKLEGATLADAFSAYRSEPTEDLSQREKDILKWEAADEGNDKRPYPIELDSETSRVVGNTDKSRIILINGAETICDVRQDTNKSQDKDAGYVGGGCTTIMSAINPATPMGTVGAVGAGKFSVTYLFPDAIKRAWLTTSDGVKREIPIVNNVANLEVKDKKAPTITWTIEGGDQIQHEL